MDIFFLPVKNTELLCPIDAEDCERVTAKNWSLTKEKYLVAEEYLACGRRCQVLLHRFILGLKRGDGKIVDHINRKPWDNRKGNLRLCLQWQNSVNRIFDRNSNGYRGVKFTKKDKKPFRAMLRANGKILYSPRFATALKAAEEYDRMAIMHHGPFATLNFKK